MLQHHGFWTLEVGRKPICSSLSRNLTFPHLGVIKKISSVTLHYANFREYGSFSATRALKNVYFAQKENPLQGDFVKLVEADFELIEVLFDENLLMKMTKAKVKKFIKSKIRNAAFKYLIEDKNEKSKVKDIIYKKFKIQKYLTSNSFSNFEVEILNKLRSRNINVKSNFKTKFTKNNIMDLECSMPDCFEIDDQPHILNCKPLLENLDQKFEINQVSYDDIFKNTKKQKKVVEVIIALLDIKKSILKPNSDKRYYY